MSLTMQDILADVLGTNGDALFLENVDINMALEDFDTEDFDIMLAGYVGSSEYAEQVVDHTVAGLESLDLALEDIGDELEGGAQYHALLSAATSSVLAFAGLEAAIVVPAFEAEEGAGGMAAKAKAVGGSIKAALQKMWNGIKSLMAKAWAAISNWFIKHVASVSRLQKSAAALQKKAAASKGKPKEAKVTINAKYLRKAEGEGITTELGQFESDIRPYITGDAIMAEAKKYVSSKIAEITKAGPSDANNSTDGLLKALGIDQSVDGTTRKRFGLPAMITRMGKGFVGGGAFVANVKEGGDTMAVSFAVAPMEKEKQEVEALDANEVKLLANKVVSLCTGIIKAGAAVKKGEGLAKELSSMVDSAVNGLKEEDASILKVKSRKASIAMQGAAKAAAAARQPSKLINHATQVASSAYIYAKTSYSNLEEAAA